MEVKPNVIINERTIKGYIELHKAYNEPLNDGKFGKIALKRVLAIFGVGALTAISLGLFFCAPIQIVVLPIISANLISLAVVDSEQIKEKKELKKKYPYLDFTLSCEDLEEILMDNEAIIYEDECFYHYDENALSKKNYIEKCDKVLNEINKMEYKTIEYKDVPKVEMPKVKKLGTMQRIK